MPVYPNCVHRHAKNAYLHRHANSDKELKILKLCILKKNKEFVEFFIRLRTKTEYLPSIRKL